MKRFAVVVFLVTISALAAKADTFQVTSGYIQPIGNSSGYNAVFFGDGFVAFGGLGILTCPIEVVSGHAVVGCAGDEYIEGGLTVLTNTGFTEQVNFGANLLTVITQAPMFPTGAPLESLSESATISGMGDCNNTGPFPLAPECAMTHFTFAGDEIWFTAILQQNPFFTDDTGAPGYDILSEKYVISTPEPSSLLLLLAAGLLLAVPGLSRFRQRLPSPLH